MNENLSPRIVKESPGRIFLRFLRFGLLAWGGPVAQIAMIRQELVEEEKWVTRDHFNRILAIYQILPGPEAHELCVHFGMLAGGKLGGILAGLGFMLPGFLLMLLLTKLYLLFGLKSPEVKAVFIGFQVAVIALIFAAVHRIGTHVLVNKKLLVIAVCSLIGHFFGLYFLIILPVAGLCYVLLEQDKKIIPGLIAIGLLLFCVLTYSPEILKQGTLVSQVANNSAIEKPTLPNIFYTGLKAGLLTFGGAYTVIPFIQQDAVGNGWLTNPQFLDGIALSGILPAPLIIFSAFVGYFGGGWAGAFIITLAIFLPAFSFTLVGYKLLDKIIHNTAMHNFLSGVTAAVIGLIGLTAIQLFRATITDLFTFVLFAVALVILFNVKYKLIGVFVILGAGLISFAWFRI